MEKKPVKKSVKPEKGLLDKAKGLFNNVDDYMEEKVKKAKKIGKKLAAKASDRLDEIAGNKKSKPKAPKTPAKVVKPKTTAASISKTVKAAPKAVKATASKVVKAAPAKAKAKPKSTKPGK